MRLVKKSFFIFVFLCMIFLLTGSFLVSQIDIGSVVNVSVEKTLVKEKPKNFCKTVATVEMNDELVVWDIVGNWYLVELENGTEGWVIKDSVNTYVSLSSETSEVVTHGNNTTAGSIGSADPSEGVYTLESIAGIDELLYERYKDSISNENYAVIDRIDDLTSTYQENPYEEFNNFRKEGELGEYIPSEETLNVSENLSLIETEEASHDYYLEDILGRSTLKEQELYYISKLATSYFVKNYKIYNNREIMDYLNKIGITLSLASEKSPAFRGNRFIVIDSNKSIVFSTPAGYTFISRGLIKRCESEDELASVLAVEIANINNRHLVNRLSWKNEKALLYKYAQMVEQSKNIDEYYEKLENNSDEIVNLMLSLVSDMVNDLNVSYYKSEILASKIDAVKLLHTAGYDANALLKTEQYYTTICIYDMETDSKESEFAKMTLEKLLDMFDIASFNSEARNKRFNKVKELLIN